MERILPGKTADLLRSLISTSSAVPLSWESNFGTLGGGVSLFLFEWTHGRECKRAEASCSGHCSSTFAEQLRRTSGSASGWSWAEVLQKVSRGKGDPRTQSEGPAVLGQLREGSDCQQRALALTYHT